MAENKHVGDDEGRKGGGSILAVPSAGRGAGGEGKPRDEAAAGPGRAQPAAEPLPAGVRGLLRIPGWPRHAARLRSPDPRDHPRPLASAAALPPPPLLHYRPLCPRLSPRAPPAGPARSSPAVSPRAGGGGRPAGTALPLPPPPPWAAPPPLRPPPPARLMGTAGAASPPPGPRGCRLWAVRAGTAPEGRVPSVHRLRAGDPPPTPTSALRPWVGDPSGGRQELGTVPCLPPPPILESAHRGLLGG